MGFELQPGASVQRQIPKPYNHGRALEQEAQRAACEPRIQPPVAQDTAGSDAAYIARETRKAVKAAARDSVALQKIAAQNEAARNKAELDRHAAMLLRPQEDF